MSKSCSFRKIGTELKKVPFLFIHNANTNASHNSTTQPMSNKQVVISQDEWSCVKSFLFHDAFESACDLANMSRVSRSWKEVVHWNEWSKAFGVFPFQKEFPSFLVPLMKCVREEGGVINHRSAMEHLKLHAGILHTVPLHVSVSFGHARIWLYFKNGNAY